MVFVVDDGITAMYPGEDDAGGGFAMGAAIAMARIAAIASRNDVIPKMMGKLDYRFTWIIPKEH